MYANRHTLPAGKSLYTVLVGDEAGGDEYDIVAPSNLNATDVIRLAWKDAKFASSYEGLDILGVSDQSAGEILWEK